MVQDTRLIELKGISKSFGDAQVLHAVDLYIRKCEFITLLGPSGCGKTTLLRIIGGFETPDAGRVLFEGADMGSVPPYRRRINTVFQKYALFSHLNVFDNIAFGLNLKSPEALGVKTRRQKKAEIARRVNRMLKLVNLRAMRNEIDRPALRRAAAARRHRARAGQRAGSAPARRAARRARPQAAQGDAARAQKHAAALGITFIYVTHDQEEALTMSDTMVVMNGGLILQQIGEPSEFTTSRRTPLSPTSSARATFSRRHHARGPLVEILRRKFACVDEGFGKDEPVDVVIRPEDIEVVPADDGMLTGTVESRLSSRACTTR